MSPGMRLLLLPLCAAALLVSTLRAEEAPVVVKINAVPGLKFDVTRFAVRPGAKVTIQLQNPDQMIHNLVVTEPGARIEVVNAALALGAEGPAKSYVPESKKVLWAIKALNPGASGELSFTAPTTEAVYPYVCTFPGHGYLMYGAMYVTTKPLPPLARDPHVPPEVAPITDASDHSHHILDRPVVSRTFLPDCGPAAIAVGLPGGQSYVFDAGLCRLRYAWKGGYVDNGEHWAGKGEAFGKVVGRIWYRAPGAAVIRIGDARAEPAARWKGYELKKEGPVFRYTLATSSAEGVEVLESPRALKEGSGIEFSYQISGLGTQPVYLVTDREGGAELKASAGTWKDGVLTLSAAEAARFTLTMTERPKVEPLAYWSMNDSPLPSRKDPRPGVLGRAFTPGGGDAKPRRLSTGIKTSALKNGGTLSAWVLVSENKGNPNTATDEPVFSAGDGPNAIPLLPLKMSAAGTEKWTFVACTVKPDGTVSVYANGNGHANGTAEEPLKWPEPDEEIYIGSLGEKRFLRGLIDEVRIWDRALSTEELERIYTRDSANLKGAQ